MWRSTLYDMPKWISDGLVDGSIEKIEYSADHSKDVLVFKNGERQEIDMRRKENYDYMRDYFT